METALTVERRDTSLLIVPHLRIPSSLQLRNMPNSSIGIRRKQLKI
jgi:hypothetical protein